MHRKAIKKLHPKYKFCPTECEKKGFNRRRREKCETCPLKNPEKIFREKTFEMLEKMIGWRMAGRTDFDETLQILYSVMSFEDAPKERLSVKNNLLLNIYLSERQFRDELDELEKKT